MIIEECALIALSQRTTLRHNSIYAGFDSSFNIRYLEPLTGDIFSAQYADFHFGESIFPKSGGENILHKLCDIIECISFEFY